MATVSQLRPLGDPAKPFWTYADLAEVFSLSIDTLRRRMVQFEAQGFPVPQPWHKRENRWHPASVLAWKARRETAVHARTPDLVLMQGGRA